MLQQLLGSAALVLGGGLDAPRYPLYKQCDPLWGAQPMGTAGPGERATVCREGCAMTAVAMALAGQGYGIPPGDAATSLGPATAGTRIPTTPTSTPASGSVSRTTQGC